VADPVTSHSPDGSYTITTPDGASTLYDAHGFAVAHSGPATTAIMHGDPSPFIQEHWMHGAAPAVFAGTLLLSLGYAVGALMGRHAAFLEARKTPPKHTIYGNPHDGFLIIETDAAGKSDPDTGLLRPFWHRNTPDA
jgi:hypothetical protein